MKALERTLRDVRAAGRKALVPYFVAGLTPDWVQHVEAAIHAGADAVEVGIPFSDPMIDGVIIQEAAQRALRAGTTVDTICRDVAALAGSVPLVAMTYYNVVHHYGLERTAGKFQASGVLGAIIPDLALEESSDWTRACDDAGVATVFLVAPSTPPARVALLAARSEGFAYAAARMAVTGLSKDPGHAERVVGAIRAVSDIPTLVGIGISTPDQARTAAALSDGVIVGTALVRVILEGGGTPEVEGLVRSFRSAL